MLPSLEAKITNNKLIAFLPKRILIPLHLQFIEWIHGISLSRYFIVNVQNIGIVHVSRSTRMNKNCLYYTIHSLCWRHAVKTLKNSNNNNNLIWMKNKIFFTHEKCFRFQLCACMSIVLPIFKIIDFFAFDFDQWNIIWVEKAKRNKTKTTNMSFAINFRSKNKKQSHLSWWFCN